MAWREAKSLLKLLAQVNALVPNRSKSSDGMVGDLSHQARVSDHNPNPSGVVCALDITHDPHGGFDSYAFAEMLRKNKDARIKYVISNRKIFTNKNWKWGPYDGPNPHNHHVHVSVKANVADDETPWVIDVVMPVADPTVPPLRPVLRKGSKGDDVLKLQRALGITADGSFGPATEVAVKKLQREHDIHPDGIVGPYTWDKLPKES